MKALWKVGSDPQQNTAPIFPARYCAVGENLRHSFPYNLSDIVLQSLEKLEPCNCAPPATNSPPTICVIKLPENDVLLVRGYQNWLTKISKAGRD